MLVAGATVALSFATLSGRQRYSPTQELGHATVFVHRRRVPRLVTYAARLVRRFLYAAVAIALMAAALALAAVVAPSALGYSTITVHGGSMTGSIPNGSLVVARWLPAENVKLRDVILVREDSGGGPSVPRLHRIVTRYQDGGQVIVRTKGDANHTVDPQPYVLPGRVLTPTYRVPYLGYLAAFVVTPLGWLLTVALPATLLCAAVLGAIWLPQAAPSDGLGPGP